MLPSTHHRAVLLACGVACAAITVDDATIPTKPADASVVTPGNIETFAMDSILLGEAPRAGGAPVSTAWQEYGYDLDGLITTSDSINVCSLTAGAPIANQVDGDGGVDNAFGRLLFPTLGVPTPSDAETYSIRAGQWTIQIETNGLPTTDGSATGITAQVFLSLAYDNGTPTFDSSTDWPVVPSSLVDHATIAGGATVQFPDAYVVDGLFVSGFATEPLVVPLWLGTNFMAITIRHAVVSFRRSGTQLVDGTIAGVIDTPQFVDALQNLAGVTSPGLCGSGFDQIAHEIEKAQDIFVDGTNGPGKPCNAISIGLGFTARQVANPTKVSTNDLVVPHPCDADAGDASTD